MPDDAPFSLLSIRMRASLRGAHISGGERLLKEETVDRILADLIWRALTSYRTPDAISLTIESVDPESVTHLKSPDIRTITSSSPQEAIEIAGEILTTNGISSPAIEKGISLLRMGPARGGKNMRGACIMDAFSGERLEPDRERGIRVSRIDYTGEARNRLEQGLMESGIYQQRIVDALAIAAKVTGRNETVAELCWSDNPEYTTGYVASGKSGYVRITNMKKKGSVRGGRIFFVNPEGLEIDPYIDYLERKPVIIDRIGKIYD